jgi:hypothetical protein
MKVELAVLEGALECRNELAAKDATKHLNGKKEGVAGLDPVPAIGRQPTIRDNTMHMRVQLEFLIPGVQHAEETDFRAEMSRIASEFEERFRRFETIDRRLSFCSAKPTGLTDAAG